MSHLLVRAVGGGGQRRRSHQAHRRGEPDVQTSRDRASNSIAACTLQLLKIEKA